MVTLRKAIPVLCLATSLAGLAVHAQTTATAPETTNATGAAAGSNGWHRHGHRGGMFFVLHKLNLTAEQKTEIKSIMAEQRSQYASLHASVEANRTALATTPPTDPGYATLIQTAQANASAHIRLQSETWAAIYGKLTTQQQQAIPGIVAAAKEAREARMAAWKAAHPETAQADE